MEAGREGTEAAEGFGGVLRGGGFVELLAAGDVDACGFLGMGGVKVEQGGVVLRYPPLPCSSPYGTSSRMLCFATGEDGLVDGPFQKKGGACAGGGDCTSSSTSSSSSNSGISKPKMEEGRGGGWSTGAASTRGRTGSGRARAPKKPRKAVQQSTTTTTPNSVGATKARKEKVGDRIVALQQLVSPFGKSDTASVLLEALGYIKFLHDQVQVLSSPYLQQLPSSSPPRHNLHGSRSDLRSRGLCLVPITCTAHVAGSNGADLWSPAMGSCSDPAVTKH